MEFHSHKNILSNFYPCEIQVDENIFHSVEHGYQWYKAKDAQLENLAAQIKEVPHAGKAKFLSKTLPEDFRQNWEKVNMAVMKTLLEAKISQVPAFKAPLLESDGYFLAETTSDCF